MSAALRIIARAFLAALGWSLGRMLGKDIGKGLGL